MIKQLSVKTTGQGLYLITNQIEHIIDQFCTYGEDERTSEGLCTIFLQHTSASLIIQENADPSARRDLEMWLNRLIPENDLLYKHTNEGPDDMPAHIKATLTATMISIPFIDNKLALGTWQGIYLWEHRRAACIRDMIIHIGK